MIIQLWDGQEMNESLLSVLVRKHLYVKQRVCGMQAVAKLFIPQVPSGMEGRDSLLSTDLKARLSTRAKAPCSDSLEGTLSIIEGEKCRPDRVKQEGALSRKRITILRQAEHGLLNLK